MVRFLAASDFHGNISIAEYLSEKARRNKVDLVVIAGDLNGYWQEESNILDPFLKKKQKVLFIPGNSDSDIEHQELSEKAKSIHNYYVTYDGVGFIGFGVSEMKMSLDKSDARDLDKLFFQVKSKKKVFVSHLHAKGTKAEFSGIPGDQVVRDIVEKFSPNLLLAGHIHEGEGIEDRIGKTKVLQIGRQGRIIEI